MLFPILTKSSVFFLLLSSFSFARLADEQNNVDIYQKCGPGVVNITATTLTQDFFFDIIPQKGQGSGAIIRPEGYIVTNEHVVGNAQDVEVTLYDKTQFPAKVVATDPDSDIAVIKIDPKGRKLTSLEWGDPASLAVGEKVLAIGNPFGLGGSLSVGVISSLGRDIRTQTDRLVKDVIQTDAAINPGNSGGPLLDSSGKIAGLNAQIFSRSGGSEGIGFAISVKTVRKMVEQLIQFKRVLRPDLGIHGVGLNARLFANLDIPTQNGVMITEIYTKGPAAKAGLKGATKELVYGFHRIPIGGDVIYKIDNVNVSSMRDILDYLVDKNVGDTITIHYIRGKAKKSIAVKLSVTPGDYDQGSGDL